MLLNGRRCLRRLSCKFIRSGSLSSNKYESMSVSLIDSYQQNSVVQLNGLCSGQLSVLVQSVFSRIDDVSSHKLQAVLDDSLNETVDFLLGPPSLTQLQGVQSEFEKDTLRITLKEIPRKGFFLSLRDTSISDQKKIGFVRPKDQVSEKELGDLLQLVTDERPATLFHFAPVSVTTSTLYIKWLKNSSIDQHAFVNPNSILGESASVEDEREFLRSNPHPCTVVPLKKGQTLPIVDGRIVINTAPSNSSFPFKQSSISSNGSFHSAGDEARKMQKEYEKSRKAYANEQSKGVMKKREKAQNSNFHIVNKIGSISFHVLNNGAPGTKPSIALSCAGKVFLFNCGEGTQLAMLEGSKILKNVDYIFVTSSDFETFAGLLPLILSTENWGASEIVVYGPEKVQQFMKGSPSLLKFFDNYELRNVRCENIMEKPVEDIVTIKGVEVTSQDHSKPANLCYICNLPERPGAFSVEKAKKLGLKPGPVVGRIKKGETVVLEDGTTIRPEDVLDPGTKYPPILIIDVTDETYLDSLINHSLWRALESKAYLIIHLASDEVVSSSIYSNFIKDLSDQNTKQVYLNAKASVQSSVEGIYHVNYLLNQCSPSLFPLIYGSAFKTWNCEKSAEDDNVATAGTSYQLWDSSGKLITRTGLSLTKEALVRTDPKFYKLFGQSTRSMAYDQVLADENFRKITEDIESRIEQIKLSPNVQFPRLICLGTSSAGPSKYRNVSGYYFQINPENSILLDCGENSFSQICRHFGPEEALKKLTQIGLVFLSHTHADHISGLPLLLLKRFAAFQKLEVPYKPLTVICPTFGHIKHLNSLEQEFGLELFDRDSDSLLLCEETINGFKKNPSDETAFKQNLERVGLESFTCVPVDHRTFKSFGCTFVTKEKFKVAYSGDTLPCKSLADAAAYSDLLIHEATHTDDKKYEAFCAKHTTVSEALKMHKVTSAKFTLLTHFTHRYSKCVPVDIPELSWKDVGIAFDHLDMAPDQYCVLPKLIEAYKLVFQDHLDRFKDTVSSKPIDVDDIMIENIAEQEDLELQIAKKARLDSK